MNKDKIILDLCGGTGAWSKPYKDAGYDVRNITLPTFDVKLWKKYPEIIEPVDSGRVYGILAAPPCTMFSRARTTGRTPRDFRGAMSVVKACLEIIWETQYRNEFYLKFWALENPAGHLKRFLGKPAFKFQPYDFGDRHSKETYLWGSFNEPQRDIKNAWNNKLTGEEVLRSRNNTRKLPEIPEDYIRDGEMTAVQIKRSITPPAFSKAFFEANQ